MAYRLAISEWCPMLAPRRIPTKVGWSAPTWAGLCALINEARQRNGRKPLSYLNPLIYPLIGGNCFRDVLTGSNGAYSCGSGYDLVTGIGSPDLKQLVAKLA